MARIPIRDYQVGVADGQVAPYQNVENAGALGRQIGNSISSIGSDVFAYQSQQNLVEARLAQVERNQTLQQDLANANLDLKNLSLDAISTPDPEASYASGLDTLKKQWSEKYNGNPEFASRVGVLARSSGLDVKSAALRQREQTAVGRFGNTIDTLLRTGGMSGSDAERDANTRQAFDVIDRAVADGIIRADQGDAQKQRYTANLQELTLRRRGEQNPDAALADLRAGRYDAIDPDKRQGFSEHFLRASEADARQRQADADRQRVIEERDKAEKNAWFTVDLERKVKAGDAGLKDIEAARADDRLTPSQYDSLTTTWDSEQKRRLKEADEQKRVADAMARVSGGAILNPKSKDDRDAVDAWFTQQAQGAQPDDLQNLIITTSERTGIIPPTVVGQLNGAARGTPERMAWGANTFQTLDQQAPQTLDDLPDETKRSYRLMSQYLNAGYGPADAQKRVQTDMQVTDQVKNERDKFVKEGGSAAPSELAWTWFRGGSDGAARSDQSFWERGDQGLDNAELADQVKSAFQRDYAAAYRLTGNDEAARAEAATNIKKRWWVTDVDGTRRWMQYAPELVYGGRDRASSEWIGQQLIEQAAAAEVGVSKPQAPPSQGLVVPGNITDLWDRKVLHNPDGSVSTTSSMSISTDRGEVLIPTVIDGKRLTDDEAVNEFMQTGHHLGIFDTPDHADAYAEALHDAQADYLSAKNSAIKDRADKLRGTLSIVSDQLTTRAASAGLPPTYGVWRRTESGMMEPIYEADGSQMRFQPRPPTTSDTHAADVQKLQDERTRRMDPASYAPGAGEAMP